MNTLHRARSLRCIINGKVVSLGELHGCPWGSRCGYAVRPRKVTAAEKKLLHTLQSLLPKWSLLHAAHLREITAPADGVVTDLTSDRLTLRTGDGIPVTIAVGKGLKFTTELGQQLRCNQVICRATYEQLLRNGFNGKLAVFFPEPDKITELHIFSGYRRATHRTAFYRTQHP